MTGMVLVYAIVVLGALVLSPSEAWAWGPGMHVEIAHHALAHFALIAPVIRKLMKQFPEAFIYGAASPDIIVGKKYAGYLHHCHSWRMGRLILGEAETPRQQAAAYGYLMHLAADVVAHNYYIPVKIIRSWKARILSHTYWEVRFDLGVSEEAWKGLDMVTELEIEEFDRLLERVLKKTLFSFATNKRIFNTILILQKMRSMRRSLRLYADYSRFDMVQENREHYAELALESAMDFLKHPEKAACLQIDPAGYLRLDYAKQMRRSIRGMVKKGVMSEEKAEKLVELTRERLAVALYRPDLMLPAIMDVL